MKLLFFTTTLFELVHHAMSVYFDQWRCPTHLHSADADRVRVIGDKCYEFPKAKKYWPEARLQCEHAGVNLQTGANHQGRLVEIYNAETQRALATALHSMVWRDKYVWIGANDRAKNHHWKWTSGNTLNYTNWMSNEPESGILSHFQDCAAMFRGAGWQWKDRQCSLVGLKYKFICQYNMIPPPPPPTRPVSFTTPVFFTDPASFTTQKILSSFSSTSRVNNQPVTEQVSQERQSGVLLSTGAIAGIALAIVLLIVLLIILIFALFCRSRRKQSTSQHTSTGELQTQSNPVFFTSETERISAYDGVHNATGMSNCVYNEVRYYGGGQAPGYKLDPPSYTEKSPLPEEQPNGFSLDSEFRQGAAAAPDSRLYTNHSVAADEPPPPLPQKTYK